MAPVRLDVLDPAEAQALLAAILSPDEPGEADGAAGLCAELGFLPLAIEQAGAYLAQAGATPREYLDLLARYPAAMYQAAAEGGDAARTIARIWHVTLDRLADDPLAGQVLRILAWYAPEAIPRMLLDGLADPPAVLRAVGRLAAYSMLTAERGHPGPAPAGAGRDPHPRPGRPPPRPPGDRPTPGTRPPASSPAPCPNRKIRRAGRAGGCCSRTSTPWPATHHRTPTPRPPPTSSTRPELFLDGQGQPGRAAGYLQRALADYGRVLGADHPDTLTSRNNLAAAYRAAGDLGRAIPLHEQTLADRERVLGADHPDTLTSRNNLADAYQAAGDLGRAIPLYEQTLADRERVLGAGPPRHPDLAEQPRLRLPGRGGPGRAIPLHEQTLADRERVLGAGPPRHPDLAEQPRLRLPGGGGPGPGHPAVRADPGRPGAGAGRRTTPTP